MHGAQRVALASILLMAACALPSVQAQPTRTDRDSVASGIQRALGAPIPQLSPRPIDHAALERFYDARDFHPAWAGNAAAERARAAALTALAMASEHGLDPSDYAVPGMAERPWPVSAEAAAQSDTLLTDAFLRYMRDLRLGRTAPAAVYQDVDLPAQSYDPVPALQRALAVGDLQPLLADLPPPGLSYAALKTALGRYRALAVGGGWPQLPPGATFDAYAGDGRALLLRRRLAIEDPDLSPTPAPTRPDDLDQAIRRYQARNGLDVDGRVGARTLASLNVTARQRVDQIRANMERWRWLPRRFEDRYVTVNVADAQLEVIEKGVPRLASRIVVGDRRHPSPMFRAMATEVTANPPWNVPSSIARAEILPRLRRDPNYLRTENMVLLNGPLGDPHGLAVNWRAVSGARFPYRIQQLPSPRNALGAIKLELPNRFDVYLHDTPAKGLFARADRALSHGCIRVQQILPLASVALTGDATQGIAALQEAIASAETQHLVLPHPLPIYVLYWTAVANADGTVGFRDDIYHRDERLLAVLDQRRPQPYASVPVASVGCPAQRSAG